MSDLQVQSTKPTSERPILVGLLIDVSASMLSSIRNTSGPTQTRLESLRDALDDLVEQGKKLCQDEANKEIIPLFKLFAYGFGFGNPLSVLLGNRGPKVRDLLDLPGASVSTVAIDRLVYNWDTYKSHVVNMGRHMLGDTPMLEAFKVVKERFKREKEEGLITDPPILFILSDGEPTDSTPEAILRAADDLKAMGVLIISCYVTNENITTPKNLYNTIQPYWPEGAALMFGCSSVISSQSSFYTYLQEFHWEIEEDARFFTQINQSEILKEFLRVVLSPLSQQSKPALLPKKTRVFVSYSHQDRKYLEDGLLLDYLKGLEQEGFDFWSDERIITSEIWDEEIKKQMSSADIALVLVSQSFLNSKYCREVEITTFIEERKKRGLRIFPIILSACDWKKQDWLRTTQFQPSGGKTIEGDYRDRGKRSELFFKVLQDLREVGQDINKA